MGRKPLGLLGLFGLMDVPAVQLTLCRFPILCDLFDPILCDLFDKKFGV